MCDCPLLRWVCNGPTGSWCLCFSAWASARRSQGRGPVASQRPPASSRKCACHGSALRPGRRGGSGSAPRRLCARRLSGCSGRRGRVRCHGAMRPGRCRYFELTPAGRCRIGARRRFATAVRNSRPPELRSAQSGVSDNPSRGRHRTDPPEDRIFRPTGRVRRGAGGTASATGPSLTAPHGDEMCRRGTTAGVVRPVDPQTKYAAS